MTSSGRRQSSYLFAFLAPAAALYLIFCLIPNIASLLLSFFTDDSAGSRHWTGFANYVELFSDDYWSQRLLAAFAHSAEMFLVGASTLIPAALLVAGLLARQGLRGVGAYRALLYLPSMLSAVAAAFIWQLILNPTWPVMLVLGSVIGWSGASAPWLGMPSTALIATSLIGAWQYFGIPLLLFHATLDSIPKDLLDAARLDGATETQVFFKIQLPFLAPAIRLIVVILFVNSVSAFDLVYALQGALAGPSYATDVPGTLFYRTYFGTSTAPGKAAMGAAIASVLLTTIVAFLALTTAFTKARRRYARPHGAGGAT